MIHMTSSLRTVSASVACENNQCAVCDSGGDRDRDRDSSSSSSRIREGDKVEAKCTGWTKFYKGEVTRVNSDDTYDIKFEDGERKRGVTKDQSQSVDVVVMIVIATATRLPHRVGFVRAIV